jgi:hypothetical protein
MPAPITEFVDVNVALAGASATKFQFGALAGVFLTTDVTSRQFGPFFSQAEVVAASLGSSTAEDWSGIVFSQDNGVDSVIIGREDAGDATMTVTLDAIEAEDSESWYVTNLESRVEADILAAAAWAEARNGNTTAPKIYIAQSLDADILVGGTGIGFDLAAFNYNRTALAYHSVDTEYLDGAWSSVGGGLNLDTPGGVGVWTYKPVGGGFSGVPIDVFTSAQALAAYADAVNLYGPAKGLDFISKGTMASGRFIDITTSIDWTKVRLQEKIIETFVGAPTKIPYTNAGINIIVAAIQEVMTQGVSFGHFSPDIPPRIIAPNVFQVSQADKTLRVLTIQVEVTLAGAIQKVIINVNVEF